MYALEIATQLVYTPKKMIEHVSGVIQLAHSATDQTIMSVLIVTMDLSVWVTTCVTPNAFLKIPLFWKERAGLMMTAVNVTNLNNNS